MYMNNKYSTNTTYAQLIFGFEYFLSEISNYIEHAKTNLHGYDKLTFYN